VISAKSLTDTSSDGISIENNPVINGTLNLNKSTNASYSISNINGQTVQSGTTNGNTIDVSGLNNGLYILQITNQGNTEVKKIIIQ